jgi:hypothetical protein
LLGLHCVLVILQPMKQEPPLMAKCKDKFLICSAEIPVEKESMALTEYVSICRVYPRYPDITAADRTAIE